MEDPLLGYFDWCADGGIVLSHRSTGLLCEDVPVAAAGACSHRLPAILFSLSL